MKSLLITFSMMLLFSCGEEASVDRSLEKTRLAKNRAKWEGLASNDYAFYYREPVGPAGNNRVLIEVLNQQVRTLTPAPEENEPAFTILPENRALYPSMEADQRQL